MNANKLVIGLTGMPGSGKSLVVAAAKNLGYQVVTMGDVIREETAKRGLEPTPQNVGKVMLELRAERGAGVVAEKCLPKIGETQSAKIIVDGLRSYFEAEVFQANLANFTLVTVHSSPLVRFERLSTRGRSDDPPTWDVFHERDMRELGVGIGNAISLSEYVIINDGSMECLNAKVAEVLRRAEEQWFK
ncbi:MAG: AAA family ATPase [Candidatus Bathyarchaeota archaeon]|nr:AAA family ATPase [Candidatus Bathyarchaeota archaeon]